MLSETFECQVNSMTEFLQFYIKLRHFCYFRQKVHVKWVSTNLLTKTHPHICTNFFRISKLISCESQVFPNGSSKFEHLLDDFQFSLEIMKVVALPRNPRSAVYYFSIFLSLWEYDKEKKTAFSLLVKVSSAVIL